MVLYLLIKEADRYFFDDMLLLSFREWFSNTDKNNHFDHSLRKKDI